MKTSLVLLLNLASCVPLALCGEPSCNKDGGVEGCVTNTKVESIDMYRQPTPGPDDKLTTNQGIPIADNQNSLKAGPRGPTLLEDFIMREKIMHFDHERIPERIVHARGSAAHGYFESYGNAEQFTKAHFLQGARRTPVFVRFSTVAGSMGSADTVRDIRGFATKFYTEEGNFDIVGNNVPVFFVQDAMKFPDFVHSVKPEPHNDMPQASSAHNNLWDFVATQTETFHAILWAMSDRAIPRYLSMMQGFGVHTFRLINSTGHSHFAKFHWRPKLGVHSLVWDEAQKLAGKNSDFHRAHLWESIEQNHFPEWELGIQIVDENEELGLGYDILDPTKIIPEERRPVVYVGRMVLNRNPDNYFAEAEQVAYCVANIVPGIDFTNDPLMQGRLFSYLDTQLSRLGGPNFHEIPINRPVCPFRNNQRDGKHRQTINVGTTNYDINTINNGNPGQAGDAGFNSYPEPMLGTKIRTRSPSFGDHFSQPTMFYRSLSQPEQDHIVSALSFELAKVSIPSIRQRVVDHLQAIDASLARRVADNLNIALGPNPHPGYPKDTVLSPALSQANFVNESLIEARTVAILTADGVDGRSVQRIRESLTARGASVKIIAPKIGTLRSSTGGDPITVDATIAGSPSILFDALYIPGGREAIKTLQADGGAVHYALESFVHLKPIAASGEGADFLAHIALTSRNKDDLLPKGVLISITNNVSDYFRDQFIKYIGRHRFYDRERVNAIPA